MSSARRALVAPAALATGTQVRTAGGTCSARLAFPI
jgi:hypothetical protein